MADEAPTEAGGVSKTACKKAADDAGKAAKKKPDPEGLALIEQAKEAYAAKDLEKAFALYKEAEEKCKNSTMDAVPKEKKPKGPNLHAAATDAAAELAADDATAAEAEKKPRLYLSNPEENLQAKPTREGMAAGCNYALNSPAKLKKHLETTGGAYRTRFPPEPNGYLHIGHAKAMNFNFGQARIAREMGKGGTTVMRFDDTNPAAEKQEFIDSILDNLKWLGHEPARVTYSSDYFQELYDLAVQLIKDGGAYVCHQTGPEIKASRELLRAYHGRGLKASERGPLPQGAASPWRDRPVAENLAEFRKMKQGRYAQGTAFLRHKGDLFSENSSMWDLAAYRIIYQAHPHTGDAWCIYPTYDYTHCIVDSLEDITHSLCTLEFAQRQAADGPYYHLLHSLGMYKPVTWEYSRLNLTHAVMSKRKLKFLVVYGYVGGWDDPRLCTLNGLRRRGYTGATLNRFCEAVGVTRAAMVARNELLEQLARQELEAVPRRFAVLKPLKVLLSGLAEGGKSFEMKNHPLIDAMGARQMHLGSEIYIEMDDFRPELADDPKFYGLAVGREAGLLGAGVNITVTEAVRDPKTGELLHLLATADPTRERKVKGHLHWVNAQTAVPAECRVYSVLFSPEDPELAAKEIAAAAGAAEAEENDDNDEDNDDADAAALEEAKAKAAAAAAAGKVALPKWLELLNPDSLVVESALVESCLAKEAAPPNKAADRPAFQFQRVGFFCVDDDSTTANPVFNRIVALKEDKEKKTL